MGRADKRLIEKYKKTPAYWAGFGEGKRWMIYKMAQHCLDMMLIAVDNVFDITPEQARDLASSFSECNDGWAEMVMDDAKDDSDLIYSEETVERRLRQICGENYQSREVRYAEIAASLIGSAKQKGGDE